jgi:plastocyanin
MSQKIRKKEKAMRAVCRVSAIFVALLLAAGGLLYSGRMVNAAAQGQIAGSIKFDGTAPHQKIIDMSKDPSCAQTHTGAPATMESVVVGPNGGLANVVVYISQGLTGNEAVASQPVKMEQKGCQYFPHVLAMNVGQHLTVMNDDKTAHNIHPEPKPGGGNITWNKSQMEGSPALDVTWPAAEIAIPVKCNIHPWMRAYIAVVKGPYSVSSNTGEFKLDGLAPGTYTLTAWHETYGTQTQTVTVAAGKPAAADFTFKAK